MIIVIGKNGQLALELTSLLGNNPHQCLGRDDINISDFASMNATLKELKPTAIINASAYTAVDKAESEPETAFELNHLAVKNLALYAKHNAVFLVHVSTDYVFGGDKGTPYKTTDDYHPQGVYGASKAAGEKSILELCPDHACIIRTSWVYSCHGNNFVKTMLRLMQEKPELGVIDDQIGTPTSANALASCCIIAVLNKVNGIHHFTDAGVASWYDFACAIQDIALSLGMLQKTIPIKPVPSSAYPTPAKRPHYSVLDKSSLMDSFDGLQPQHWRVELTKVLKALS
ncbi:MAG: dTDP-4-dehydrorhamnose reductase [Arenicella sp.]|jgi:dTDP-4-dehydrorhamnose reductase